MGIRCIPKTKCLLSSKVVCLKAVHLIVILLIIASGGCSDKDRDTAPEPYEKITLAIPAPDYPLFLALILLAKEEGFFKEYGLDVVNKLYPHGVTSLKALQTGEVDMAVGAEFPFVKQSLGGSKMKIIASVSQVDVLELIARKDSGISKPSDLRGKRVALIKGSQLEFCLDRFIIRYRLNLKDIEILDLPPPGIEKSILEGAADAIVFREPMSSRVKTGLGENWISWWIQEQRKLFWIIACNDAYVVKHPKTIKRFLRAIRKAELFFLKSPQKAIDIIIKRGILEPKQFSRMLPKIEYRLSLDKALLIAMEDEVRWHIKNRYTEAKRVPNYLDRIYFDALESVNPDAVNIIH
jgi:ABC-type nitrate/sulfonate/bicarbonate transport system substrate-binding protein